MLLSSFISDMTFSFVTENKKPPQIKVGWLESKQQIQFCRAYSYISHTPTKRVGGLTSFQTTVSRLFSSRRQNTCRYVNDNSRFIKNQSVLNHYTDRNVIFIKKYLILLNKHYNMTARLWGVSSAG